MTRRHIRARSSIAQQLLTKAFLLAAFILGCANADAAPVAVGEYHMPTDAVRVLLLRDTTTAERAKIRGDSILIAARCWQFVRAPVPYAATSACPDSAEATALVRYAPMTRATATGMRVMMAIGDTLQLRAVIIRGYLFVGPAMTPLARPAPSHGA